MSVDPLVFTLLVSLALVIGFALGFCTCLLASTRRLASPAQQSNNRRGPRHA